VPDRNVHMLLCIVTFLKHVCDQYVFFWELGDYSNGHTLIGSLELCQVHVRHLLHLLKVLQFLVVRVPEL
jgi:hypothetical protein